jgi:hypothetical protein
MGKRLITSLLSILLLAAAPAFATEIIDDDGLERLTAAGDPVVINSSGATSSLVNFADAATFKLTLPANAQMGLQALTIQNVVGEAQLLVNLNVLSASSNVAGTNQQNFSLQSWGSTDPIVGTGLTVAGVSAAAAPCGVANACGGSGGNAGSASGGGASSSPGGTGGSTGAAGTATSVNTPTISSPSGGTNTIASSSAASANAMAGAGGNAAAAPGGNATANAGNGGNAPLIVSGNAAAAVIPGLISPTTSASGDLIINSSSSGGTSTVNAASTPTFTLNFASQAQTDLSALFISNVVGSAQMAMNLNIASATLNLIPSNNNQPFALPINSTSAVIQQVNVGYQFRGTPIVGSTGTSATLNISGH